MQKSAKKLMTETSSKNRSRIVSEIIAFQAMGKQGISSKISDGSTNLVGDNLSRLIKIPDRDWRSAEPDDDTVHPFLMSWTQILQRADKMQQLCFMLQAPMAGNTLEAGESATESFSMYSHRGRQCVCET